jgi:hypothetical protein
MVVDTTNTRIGIGKTPTTTLDVNGTVTATAFVGSLTGNVTGNVSGSSGSCTGNAATASSVPASGVTAGTFPSGTFDFTSPQKLKMSGMYPASDSTTALAIYKADGSTAVATIDTMNSRLGLGCTPSCSLEVRGTSAQLRLSYDGSNYTDFITNSLGNLEIAPTGGYLSLTGKALSISTTASYCPQIQLFNNNDVNTGSYFMFYRTRAGSAPVASGDALGNILWNGMYNSAYQTAAYISADVDGSPSGNYVPGVIAFGTATASAAPTERMRITSGGYVGIGCIPSYQLQLSTDSAAKPSTNTWTVPSDERLKTDIILADLDRCYEIVRDLPLKRFTWRDDVYTAEQVPDRSKLGWIAQDVEKVFPKAITITEHKISDDEIIEDCRGLNADQLYAVLWGAVQKLQLKVAALEAT